MKGSKLPLDVALCKALGISGAYASTRQGIIREWRVESRIITVVSPTNLKKRWWRKGICRIPDQPLEYSLWFVTWAVLEAHSKEDPEKFSEQGIRKKIAGALAEVQEVGRSDRLSFTVVCI
jgi:hypothetical protein